MQTLNLVNVLIGAGHNVTVCCYYEYDQGIVERFETTGAKVILMKYERAKGLWHLAKGLIQIFRREKPEIVHVQYITPGLLPIIAARIAGIKTIFATVHQPGRVYGWKEKKLLRIAARLCTAFFCNSEAVEESWFEDSEIFDSNKQYKNRKHFTIYNGVDTNHIEQITKQVDRIKLRNDLGIDNKPVIGMVGRLRQEKGQDILLDAMPEVIRVIPNVILLIVGDGPDRISLELRAKSLGLASNTLWLGQMDHEEVIKLYTIMDVVVIPSRFEGFGLSAAEAMASGRPIVASDVDGLRKIVVNGTTGYLFPVGDHQELYKILIKLVKSPEKAEVFGIKGYKHVQEIFSMERFTELTIAAYRHFTKFETFVR